MLAEVHGSAARILTKLLHRLSFLFGFKFSFSFSFESTISILDTKDWLGKEAVEGG